MNKQKIIRLLSYRHLPPLHCCRWFLGKWLKTTSERLYRLLVYSHKLRAIRFKLPPSSKRQPTQSEESIPHGFCCNSWEHTICIQQGATPPHVRVHHVQFVIFEIVHNAVAAAAVVVLQTFIWLGALLNKLEASAMAVTERTLTGC